MDSFPVLIALVFSVCIAIFGVMAVVLALYGVLIWNPRRQQRKVESLKLNGRQGEAIILQVPMGDRPSHVRRAMFIRTPIKLQISVPGIETYEVNKTFNIPSYAIDRLKEGLTVKVWVDPQNPYDQDKIVIDIP
jgi:hypothetical protein